MQKTRIGYGLLAALGAVALTLTPLAANASDGASSTSPAVSGTTTLSDVASLAPGESQTVQLKDGVTVTTQLGEPETVTVAEINADPSLTSSQKASLTAAAATLTVSSNHYSQFTTGAFYTVTQNGTFYYDGTRVWVGTTYAGKTGSHNCFINYAVGATVTNNQCTESGTTGRRDMGYSWTVSAQGITYGNSMTAKLYANGTISGFGATVG